MNGKRIIIASEMLQVGGLQNQAVLLGSYLQDQGAVVRVLGYGTPEDQLIQRFEEHALSWRQVPYPWEDGVVPSIRSLSRFARVLYLEKPDIIIPFSGPSNLACNLVWRLIGARACIWNQRDAGLDRLPSPLLRLALRLASHATSNNRLGTQYLRRHGMPQAKIAYIPDGIEELPDGIQKASDILPADFIAAMIANMVRPKDHVTLLKAWRQVVDALASQGKTANLLLIGRKGETYAEVQRTITSLNIEHAVHVVGIRSDISQLLAGIDVYIHSSTSEGCPNAVLEAMRAGLSVVGTDIPGIADVLCKENRAYLAPASDYHTLSKKIIALAADEQRLRLVGQLNRRRVLEHFLIEQVGRQTSKLLSHLV